MTVDAGQAKRTQAKPTETTPTAQAAAKKRPGRKPGQEPKPFVPLDFSQIQVTEVQSPETMRQHRRTAERDQDQQAVDTLVRKSHQRWIEAGKPEKWGECISASYTLRVPKAAQDTVERRIRRAGTYFEVAIRFGQPVELDNGHVQILFFAKDRSVKDAEANGSDADSGSAAEKV